MSPLRQKNAKSKALENNALAYSFTGHRPVRPSVHTVGNGSGTDARPQVI